MKMLAVRIQEELLKRMKHAALDKNIPIQVYVAQALVEKMAREEIDN